MNKIKRVVWKYSLDLISKVQSIEIPMRCDLLCARWFNERPTIWALVEPDGEETLRLFRVYATGEKLDNRYAHFYIGTCFQKIVGMTYVWHVFRVLQLETGESGGI